MFIYSSCYFSLFTIIRIHIKTSYPPPNLYYYTLYIFFFTQNQLLYIFFASKVISGILQERRKHVIKYPILRHFFDNSNMTYGKCFTNKHRHWAIKVYSEEVEACVCLRLYVYGLVTSIAA